MSSDHEQEEGSSEADARSIAAQNLSDLECGDDAAGSPVASPSNAAASASIDRQSGGIPGSIHTSGGSRGTRSAPGSRSSSRTPNRSSAASPSRTSRSNSRSRSRSKGSGTTTPDEINAERERRRIEALAMIREVDSRRNVLDLGPAVPPPPTASSNSNVGDGGGGGSGVAASIRNLFGSSTTQKPRATKQQRGSNKKKKGAKSVSETLAVHAGQWGGTAPYSSSAAAKGGQNATNPNANPGRAIASSIDEMMMSGMGLDVADACDPSPGMFESIRAFNMAGNGGGDGGDNENEYDDDYKDDRDGHGTKRRWKCYNVNEVKTTFSRNGVIISLGVFVAAAVAFVALIGVSSMQQQSLPSNDSDAAPPDSTSETTISTIDPPQRQPPTAPSGPQPPSLADGRLQVFMDVAVSNGITPTMDVFEDPTSPQYRAAKWITNALPLDVDYHDGNVPDLMQRYGIAAFFLSTQPVDSTVELHEQDERDDGEEENMVDDAAGMLSDDDVCDWDGIGCDNKGLVTSIDLPGSNLEGTLPYELFSSTYSSLQSLTLNDNDLSGTLPDSIVLMDNLVSLDLSDNNIGSTVPSALFGLTSLTDLVLSNNWFEGQLKASNAGEVAPLSKLILHDNYLTGSIEGLAGLPSLEVLDLNSNDLSGEIGSSLFGLSNLSFLRLSNNHLSGTLSSDIGQLTNLGTLSLDRNEHLRGTVPTEIGNLRLLESLFLHDTGLEGTIPEVVCDLI